jgi:hypothetical protein
VAVRSLRYSVDDRDPYMVARAGFSIRHLTVAALAPLDTAIKTIIAATATAVFMPASL